MKIDIDRLMRQSAHATCGTFEREIFVKDKNVKAIKKLLKSKGQMIVGTGEGELVKGKRKIWYNPEGMVGL